MKEGLCGDEEKLKQRLRLERESAEVLRSRLELLKSKDRALMELYLEHSCSIVRLAALMGQSTGAITRRIQYLTDHLTGQAEIGRFSGKLNSFQRTLARDYFIRWQSLRHIARSRDMSYYRIRKNIAEIRSMAQRSKKYTQQEQGDR